MREEGVRKLLEALGVERMDSYGDYLMVSCPLAPFTHGKGTDRNPSMRVRISEVQPSRWNCYSCNGHGDLHWLVGTWGLKTRKDVEPLHVFIDQQENSAEAIKVRLDHVVEKKWEPMPTRDWKVFEEKELDSFENMAPFYILSRGISLNTCKAWGIRYDGKFRGPGGVIQPRVVFPVRRRDGKLVGLVGRGVTDGVEPKYFNYWRFDRHLYLYGEDKIKSHERLIVVEGMIDTLMWNQYELPVAGTMGAKVADEQIQTMLGYERVYLAMDRDPAGKKAEKMLKERLKDRVPVFTVEFPEGKTDPKQLSESEAMDALEAAKLV